MKSSAALGLLAAAVGLPAFRALAGPVIDTKTWIPGAGGSWTVDANWSVGAGTGYPSGTGAGAIFNAPTATRAVTLDGAITLGSFSTDNTSTFSQTFSNGTGGSLTFDAIGSGPATITTNPTGTGTNVNTILATTILTDSVVATVGNGGTTSGSLNWTGGSSGPGGFTKQGTGTMTMSTNLKGYTGATLLDTNSGRTRISTSGMPNQTSSFTVNSGAQIDFISTGALNTYTLGPGNLNLNGTGLGVGSFAGNNPGAIRPDTGTINAISNATVLQSDTLIHVQATAGTGGNATPTGSLSFSNAVSGPGKLTITAPNSNVDIGIVTLTSTNDTYAGGTLVQGGILSVTGTGATADLGTGNVAVDNTASPSSIARLSIAAGVVNAIDDAATLSLLGGGTAGVADQNFAILGTGVNDIIGGLVLGGVAQTANGTYGSTASGATFQNDEYFSGTGVVTLVTPEPTTLAFVGLGAMGFLTRRRRAR